MWPTLSIYQLGHHDGSLISFGFVPRSLRSSTVAISTERVTDNPVTGSVNVSAATL